MFLLNLSFKHLNGGSFLLDNQIKVSISVLIVLIRILKEIQPKKIKYIYIERKK